MAEQCSSVKQTQPLCVGDEVRSCAGRRYVRLPTDRTEGSKLKTALCTRKARAQRTLARALTALLPTFSRADAGAWFRHRGYSLH